MYPKIEQPEERFAAAEEKKRLIAEGRKGGKASEHAGDEHHARLNRKDTAGFGEVREKPDQKAPQDIHRKRSKRKNNAA